MANTALAYNTKENSFVLYAQNWTEADIDKLLDDIEHPKVKIVCDVQNEALLCTIICANEQDFLQMKSELERVLD